MTKAAPPSRFPSIRYPVADAGLGHDEAGPRRIFSILCRRLLMLTRNTCSTPVLLPLNKKAAEAFSRLAAAVQYHTKIPFQTHPAYFPVNRNIRNRRDVRGGNLRDVYLSFSTIFSNSSHNGPKSSSTVSHTLSSQYLLHGVEHVTNTNQVFRRHSIPRPFASHRLESIGLTRLVYADQPFSRRISRRALAQSSPSRGNGVRLCIW